MAGNWKVIFEPQGKNPGRLTKLAGRITGVADDPDGQNVGGIVVLVTNGSTRQEVSRVAYVRSNSKNPDTSFNEQLSRETQKARDACDLLNGTLASCGELV